MKIEWNNKRNRWVVQGELTSYEWNALLEDDIEPHYDNMVPTDLVYDENLWVGHLISRCHQWGIDIELEWKTNYYRLESE